MLLGYETSEKNEERLMLFLGYGESRKNHENDIIYDKNIIIIINIYRQDL